jgi:8-oxo-dGTP pyrophosphatase MutT (NUDIX family)
MVEEDIHGQLILNQPAGHLNADETLIEAARRETLEETGWQVAIDHLIEVSQWTSPNSGTHFVRACFAGTAQQHDPSRPLDTGIVRACWMSRDEVAANAHRLRSPLVLHHIDHHIKGKHFPLDLFSYYDD